MIYVLSSLRAGWPGQSNNFTATVPVPKSFENHILKNPPFMCLPPACFETGFGFEEGFKEGYM